MDSYRIRLDYTVRIPKDKFTRYGVTPLKDYNLKYWYITPAVYDGSWHYYSNKNIDDLYVPKSDINMQLELPSIYRVASELDMVKTEKNGNSQTIYLNGKDRIDSKLFLSKLPVYKRTITDNFEVVSNITEEDLQDANKAIITDRITNFITTHWEHIPIKN